MRPDPARRQRIAIVGTGIAGLVAAHLLQRRHDVRLYEANDYIGGHTNTVEVKSGGRLYAVDTGFIVFNPPNYPNFTRLLDQLGVASKPTDMSFSVKCAVSGLEYNGTSLNGLFAQRRNVLRPAFYRMVGDIRRFNREAVQLLDDGDPSLTLGQYLRQGGYSQQFIRHHIVPLGSALWSMSLAEMEDFPAQFFVRFFDNHRFLQISGRSPWRVVEGGSSRYVQALVRPFRRSIRLACPVRSIRRTPDEVHLVLEDGETERFDQVVIATHSDQALDLLDDPTDDERQVLGAIKYQKNDVVLHSDTAVLPRRRRAWASWNYHVADGAGRRAFVTYDMNRLQGLDAPERFCVTLNDLGQIDPARVIRRLVYHHPRFNVAAVAAQSRRQQICGVGRTHYCGAYWGWGFHEDGVRSALEVGRRFGEAL